MASVHDLLLRGGIRSGIIRLVVAKSYVDQCLIVADIRDRAIVNSWASLPTIRDALGIPIGWHVRQVTIPV